MPRFHFNTHDGEGSFRDADGVIYPDTAKARAEAIRMCALLVAEQADSMIPGQDWCLEMTDDTGLVLYRIDLMLSASAAVGG